MQVGLDNAGKTTALYKLSLGQAVATVPTIGSNVERVKLENVSFEIWDLGGQASLRPTWSMYLKGVDAVIIVIDSTDRVRLPIAKQELYQILAMPELEKVPFLLLANKQVCCSQVSITCCLFVTRHLGSNVCRQELLKVS
jgi:ADP-ribosylation factor-like protein 5B